MELAASGGAGDWHFEFEEGGDEDAGTDVVQLESDVPAVPAGEQESSSNEDVQRVLLKKKKKLERHKNGNFLMSWLIKKFKCQ